MPNENGILIRSHWLPCALEGEAVERHRSNPEDRGCWLGSPLPQWRQGETKGIKRCLGGLL